MRDGEGEILINVLPICNVRHYKNTLYDRVNYTDGFTQVILEHLLMINILK